MCFSVFSRCRWPKLTSLLPWRSHGVFLYSSVCLSVRLSFVWTCDIFHSVLVSCFHCLFTNFDIVICVWHFRIVSARFMTKQGCPYDLLYFITCRRHSLTFMFEKILAETQTPATPCSPLRSSALWSDQLSERYSSRSFTISLLLLPFNCYRFIDFSLLTSSSLSSVLCCVVPVLTSRCKAFLTPCTRTPDVDLHCCWSNRINRPCTAHQLKVWRRSCLPRVAIDLYRLILSILASISSHPLYVIVVL